MLNKKKRVGGGEERFPPSREHYEITMGIPFIPLFQQQKKKHEEERKIKKKKTEEKRKADFC